MLTFDNAGGEEPGVGAGREGATSASSCTHQRPVTRAISPGRVQHPRRHPPLWKYRQGLAQAPTLHHLSQKRIDALFQSLIEMNRVEGSGERSFGMTFGES